jgi:hypothetical protein
MLAPVGAPSRAHVQASAPLALPSTTTLASPPDVHLIRNLGALARHSLSALDRGPAYLDGSQQPSGSPALQRFAVQNA